MLRLAALVALAFSAAIFVTGASTARPSVPGTAVAKLSAAELRTRREAIVLDVLNSTNSRRADLGLKRLTVLPELQLALDAFVQGGAKGGVQGAFRIAESRIPTIRKLAGNLVYGSGEAAILRELEEWSDLMGDGNTQLALQFFDDEVYGRTGCIALVANLFPEFRPPMRSVGVDAFYDVCRWCGHGHGISVAGGGQTTLVIQCPNCGRTCDLIATDSKGYWRRATQFLKPSAHSSGQGTLDEVMAIWTELTARNRYQKDAERLGGNDSWDLPDETMRRGVGDCEDTSLLLAQLLLDKGYEARVVLGKMRGQGHAWCVLRLEGQTYLLETTSRVHGLARPPYIAEVALSYEPEFQFDATAIYFKGFEGWTSEYWDHRTWTASGDADRPIASL
jgi:predicted transglutaminase-like cysteine proteinase